VGYTELMPTTSEDYVFVFSWGRVGLLLLLGISSMLVNLILTKRSQLDAWVEARPRLAGVFKTLRGFGIDPWLIYQGLHLLFVGRLPDYVKQDAAKVKDLYGKIPKAPRPPVLPVFLIALVLGLLVMLAGGCRQTLPANSPSNGSSVPDTCSVETLTGINLVCVPLATECGLSGKYETANQCPAIQTCNAVLETRKNACRE
jgi:hypothetical protein